MTGLPPALPAPYAGPPSPNGPADTPELKELVEAQVQALVSAAPAAAEMSSADRAALTERIARVATYAAALALDDWRLSEILGQRPLVQTKETLRPREEREESRPLARPMSGFEPSAASQVGTVTRATLRAISFPSFVADLVKGTFNAILDATQTQMGAFIEMLDAVAKTVEDFESENVSDLQAHQWLAQSYPQHIRLDVAADGPRAAPTDAEGVPTGLRSALNLPDEVDAIDDVTIDEVLVPAARRKLAQSRLQMLSAMVMMGLQRIVINHGRIRATMGFHIDASDAVRREQADLLDTSVTAQGQVGFGWWSASAATSVTYVRSTKADSSAELNVNADLTGEVDLTFSTDYLPLNRMATTEKIERIRANTPNPAENAPDPRTGAGPPPASESSPSAAQMVAGRFENREPLQAPTLPSITPRGQQPSAQPGAGGAHRGAGGGAGGGGGGGGGETEGASESREAGGESAAPPQPGGAREPSAGAQA